MNEVFLTKCPVCGYSQNQTEETFVKCGRCGEYYDTALFPQTKITMPEFVKAAMKKNYSLK